MKKLNLYFFGEEYPDMSDMVMYYGTFIVTGLMLLWLVVV